MSKLRYPTAAEVLAIDGNDDREGPCIQLLCWGCGYHRLINGKDATDGCECRHGGQSRLKVDAVPIETCPYIGKPVTFSASS